MTMDSEKTNAILDKAVAIMFSDYNQLFGGYGQQMMRGILAEAIEAVIPKEVELSTVQPDYESIVIQLTNELSKYPVWYDTITASTGQTIIRFIASGIAFNQFAIERAVQEGFPHLASAESSIYAATDMLGVRVQRVIPASVTVRFTRTDKDTLLEIPAYTAFAINEIPFFNRQSIIFPIDINIMDVVLTQGNVLINELVSTGQPYMDIELGNGTHDISDSDVRVQINGRDWARSTGNPWQAKAEDEVFWDNTSPQGNLVVTFGDGEYGKVPAINNTITITWVRTLGETGNFAAADLEVEYNGPSIDTQLTGLTISAIADARNMADADFYSIMAPHMRAAGANAVKRIDYRRHAVEFPHVLDALFRGQAELGPHKRSAMNVVGVTLLTAWPFSNSHWERFVEFMTERGIYKNEFLRMDPVAHTLNISADIYCTQRASLATVKQELLRSIQAMFKPRLGSLGYSIARSDITDVLEGVGETGGKVDYVVLHEPTTDLILTDKASYVKLGTVELNMLYSTRQNYPGRLDMPLV